MKLAVIGSRTFNDYGLVKKTLDPLKDSIDTIVSGGARGADYLGARYAKDHNIQLQEFLPDWQEFGKAAGFIRNKAIVKACDSLIAFWDGESRGTKHSIDLAQDAGKNVKIVLF